MSTQADTLSVDEAAARLGISPPTLRRSIATGRFPLPVIDICRRKRIPRARFEAWIAGDGYPSPPTGAGPLPPPPRSGPTS